MAFWSSETIKEKLNSLVRKANNQPADPGNIDCCAYTLTVGPEVYISPTKRSEDPKGHRKQVLGKGEHFQIPTGQFAFLLTDEYVSVPDNAIAFISMKANSKFQGLVNVSGFHVDPGWDGRLIFSVFNAGPNDITLAHGDPLFLIWYADLDRVTADKKTDTSQDEISSKIAGYIQGEVYSPVVVKEKIAELENYVSQTEHRINKRIAIAVLLALLGLFLNATWKYYFNTGNTVQSEHREVEKNKVHKSLDGQS